MHLKEEMKKIYVNIMIKVCYRYTAAFTLFLHYGDKIAVFVYYHVYHKEHMNYLRVLIQGGDLLDQHKPQSPESFEVLHTGTHAQKNL